MFGQVQFFEKPGEGRIVSFHQDKPYWQLSGNSVVTVWVALTNSEKKSGALEVVPNSHNMGLINELDVKNPRDSYIQGEKTTKAQDLLSFNQNLEDFIKKNPPETIKLDQGQYSIHHVNTVHGSGINNTNKYRVGFAIRYVSSETKHLKESSDRAVHICGNKNSYYEHEKRPTEDFSDEAIKEYYLSTNSTGVFGNKAY